MKLAKETADVMEEIERTQKRNTRRLAVWLFLSWAAFTLSLWLVSDIGPIFGG